jgi:hypothetical protein
MRGDLYAGEGLYVTFGGFEVGKIYNRRRDIHAKYRGQQQGGICTPQDYPVVIAFTGTSGPRAWILRYLDARRRVPVLRRGSERRYELEGRQRRHS